MKSPLHICIYGPKIPTFSAMKPTIYYTNYKYPHKIRKPKSASSQPKITNFQTNKKNQIKQKKTHLHYQSKSIKKIGREKDITVTLS